MKKVPFVPNFDGVKLNYQDILKEIENPLNKGSDRIISLQENELEEIKLYWKSNSEKCGCGYIEKIILPNGNTILFDDVKGCIDFSPCKRFIGCSVTMYQDGEKSWTQKLKTINSAYGVDQMVFEDYPSAIFEQNKEV